MKTKSSELVTIVGQFIDYELKDGYKIKRLRLINHAGIQSIKLAKEAKACLFRLGEVHPITAGTLLSLQVKQKNDDGALELKAYTITRLDRDAAIDEFPAITPRSMGSANAVRIQVCDRGTCRKRGSAAVYDAFCQTVQAENRADQIVVEKTGCLKCCKQGVNVKINQTNHSRISVAQVRPLLSGIFTTAQ
jgi:Thioredoxin-like [2Fe-2S] ferredoxin